MKIDTNAFGATSMATYQPSPAAKTEPVAKEQAEEPKEKTLLEEIRDKGFGTFVEDLKEKKKEELRAKILESMHLTEDDLAGMPPEQRAQIEKIIAQEMLKRMTAEDELKKASEGKMSLNITPSITINSPENTKIDVAGVGLGPLLALQEIDQNREQNPPKEEKITG